MKIKNKKHMDLHNIFPWNAAGEKRSTAAPLNDPILLQRAANQLYICRGPMLMQPHAI